MRLSLDTRQNQFADRRAVRSAQGDNPMRSLIASLLFVVLALSNTACIGRMATSGLVRNFNLEVTQDQWAREVVFLCLYIIPVYPIAGSIDLIIVNSIEFWTGTNPIDGGERLARAGETRHVVSADGSEATSTFREDGSIDLEILAADGSTHFLNVIREEGQVVARDAEGRAMASVDSRTGEITPIVELTSRQ
jgi:hypothetical protein